MSKNFWKSDHRVLRLNFILLLSGNLVSPEACLPLLYGSAFSVLAILGIKPTPRAWHTPEGPFQPSTQTRLTHPPSQSSHTPPISLPGGQLKASVSSLPMANCPCLPISCNAQPLGEEENRKLPRSLSPLPLPVLGAPVHQEVTSLYLFMLAPKPRPWRTEGTPSP